MKHLLFLLILSLPLTAAHAACPPAPTANDNLIIRFQPDGGVRTGTLPKAAASTGEDGTEGTLLYNPATKSFQFCDGTTWQAIGSNPSAPSGGATFLSFDLGSFLTVGKSASIAHNQGKTPHIFGSKAICRNSSCGGGYAANDEVWIGGAMYENETAPGSNGTHLFWASRNTVSLPTKNGSTYLNVTPSPNWNLHLWGIWLEEATHQ